MSKKLNVDQVTSELEGSAFFRPPTPTPAHPTPEENPNQPDNQPAGQSANQSTSQSAVQSTKQSTKRQTKQQESKIVDRPKGFYITERLDRRLDEAVRYLQEEHGIKKVDRSALVNALLDNDATFTQAALDRLVDRVIHQLTSRLRR